MYVQPAYLFVVDEYGHLEHRLPLTPAIIEQQSDRISMRYCQLRKRRDFYLAAEVSRPGVAEGLEESAHEYGIRAIRGGARRAREIPAIKRIRRA